MTQISESKNRHIVILTGQHACANPRVWKEANLLSKLGYKVTVLTLFYSVEKLKLDKKLIDNANVTYRSYVNLIREKSSFFRIVASKFERKLALILKKFLDLETPALLGYSPKSMLREALKLEADLYIGHMEIGLWVGVELQRRGKNVAFDIEDWYSEDYISSIRPVQLLSRLEQEACASGRYVTCPSQSMADALKTRYNFPNDCIPIYNGFSIKEGQNCTVIKHSKPSLVWFSQVVGIGRGLETLVESLKIIRSEVELHIIGEMTDDYALYLETNIPKSNVELFIHGPTRHEELICKLKNCHIGLALENNFPENKNTTISNKILQYMQADLKVIATNTRGHAEVAHNANGLVILIPVNDPTTLAHEIDVNANLISDSVSNINRAFNTIYSFESQEERLADLVAHALIQK